MTSGVVSNPIAGDGNLVTLSPIARSLNRSHNYRFVEDTLTSMFYLTLKSHSFQSSLSVPSPYMHSIM